MSEQDILSAIERAVRRILNHPRGVVCKHWAIAALLSEMEGIGYPQPDGFVEAVVKSDDEAALSFASIFETDA